MKSYLKMASTVLTVVTLQSSSAFGFGIGARSGPQEYGHPVHETITQIAALESGFANSLESKEIQNLIAGVRYNDDPKAYIDNNKLISFVSNFVGQHDDPTDVTEAFHFGAYQFVHAMARPSELAFKVQNRMVMYAYHCWLSATDSHSYAKFKVTYDIVKEKLSKNLDSAKYTPEELTVRDMIQNFSEKILFFNAKDQESFQYRALGSLLHMIQDSYAKGHTVRVGWENGNNDGAIRYFQDYEQQDSKLHKHFDIPESELVSSSTILQIPGSKPALERSKQILEMAMKKCPWSSEDLAQNRSCTQSVRSLIDGEIFKMDVSSFTDRTPHSHHQLLKRVMPTTN